MLFRISLLWAILFSVVSTINAQDVWLQSYFSPNSGCSLSNSETVNVLINNNSAGIMASNTINVSYSVNGGAPTQQLLNSNLFPGASWNFSFIVGANLSACATYAMKVWVTRFGDTNQTNDTLQWTVTNSCAIGTGTVSGSATVCQGQNAVTYTVPTIANATGYTWSLPTGATGSSTTNSITVNYSTTATSGNVSVFGTNASCPNGATSSLPVTVNPLPAGAGTISGLATVCQGQNTVTYTVPTIANATTYNWSWPTGATGSSTTNSITVNYSTTATSGNVAVFGSNVCGNGGAASRAITVNPLPANAGTISGLATVCQGQNSVTYTVPTIANATGYTWSLPTGATGSSTTNSITINYSTTATSGNVSVFGTNACGNGGTASRAITVNPLPANAGTISGLATVCQGQNAVTYTVPTIANATGYTWSLPTGATGSSTTNSITVNYSTTATSGNVSVFGTNACGNGVVALRAITVNPLPANAGTISGLATVCQGQNSVTYTVPTIANATAYNWTLPSGATGSSTTNSITVNYSTTATSGNVSVFGTNACGNGGTALRAITVNPLPASAGTISGLTTVCQGEDSVVYTIATIPNASSYQWTIPFGTSGSSTTNSIVIDYTNTITSDVLSVIGTNACGNGIGASLPITVNPLPENAGTISGLDTVCQGQDSVAYIIETIPSASSYQWTLPNGASGNSTTYSIVLDYATTATSGTLSVIGINACGIGAISTLAVSVNPLPDMVDSINGTFTVCQEQNAVDYFIPIVPNATAYVWTLPNGAIGTSTTDTISVDFSAVAETGPISVIATNGCGQGIGAVDTIIVVARPIANAGVDTTICEGGLVALSATGGTSYTWNNGADQGLVFSPDSTQTYTAFVSNGVCIATDSVTVTISPLPATPTISINGNELNSSATNGNQWYSDNGSITGANGQQYTPLSAGDYFVLVTDSLGCVSDTSNILSFTPVGMQNVSWTDAIAVYPNPAERNVTIRVQGSNEAAYQLSIINAVGQVLFTERIANGYNHIGLDGYAAGVYSLIFESDGERYTKKLVLK
jgi:hypothetical protein